MQNKLLLLDDEQPILRSLQRSLRNQRYKVSIANSASEAMALLADNDFGVIISDQRMPQMTGIEFLSQVKKLSPDTVRIVLSGYADIEAVTMAINEGHVYKFLEKPWDDNMLREVVAEAFAHHQLTRRGNQFTRIFENTIEGILITDAQRCIQSVNPAFTEITGYSSKEVVGQKPWILSSGRHDKDFYDSMWKQIYTTGEWRGEIWNKRKNGDEYCEWLNISAIRDHRGQVSQYVGLFTDITAHKQHEKELRYQAYHDALTGLPNRRMFNHELEVCINKAERSGDQLAVMVLDLDRFKNVNDVYGHDYGDLLLQEVAQRLNSVVRKSDTLARMGGDEMALLLAPISCPKDAAKVAEKILDVFVPPVNIKGETLYMSSSIGISLFPADGTTKEELFKAADVAMYNAKRKRNEYCFYEALMNAKTQQNMQLENDLRCVVEAGELVVHYQAQADVKTGQICGAEALVRWCHPVHGIIMPNDFIPLAEEIAIISDICSWVANQACEDFKVFGSCGVGLDYMAINISATQLENEHLENTLSEILKKHSIDPSKLQLELTENTFLESVPGGSNRLNSIKDIGVSLAIDDFGVGYSSIGYIKKLPVDVLKIDKSFIQDMTSSEKDAEMVKNIIHLAQGQNLKVVAEGVEDKAHLEQLEAFNCDQYQGYYLNKPLPLDAFITLLEEQQANSASCRDRF